MSIYDKASRALYPNGYIDAAVGRRLQANVTQSVRGLGTPTNQAATVNSAWYSNGLVWDDDAQEYFSVAKVSTSVLNK